MYTKRAKRSFPKALIPIHPRHDTTRHDTRTQAAHRHDDIKYNRFFPTLHQPRKEKIFFFLCECFNSCSQRRWRCEVVFPCLECWLENQSAESWISCVADRAEGGMRLTPPSKREREKKAHFTFSPPLVWGTWTFLVFRLITRYHDTTLCALKVFSLKENFPLHSQWSYHNLISHCHQHNFQARHRGMSSETSSNKGEGVISIIRNLWGKTVTLSENEALFRLSKINKIRERERERENDFLFFFRRKII